MRRPRASLLWSCVLLATLVVSVLLLVRTPAGIAARPPSEPEYGEIFRAAANGMGAGDARGGFELTAVRISTVDGRWAAARLILTNESGVVHGDGLAILDRLAGHWLLDFYDYQHGGAGDCGPGATIPVPIPVQVDLRLPSCPLGSATLGEDATVPDAAGDLLTKPRSLTVEAKSGPVRFVEIGGWETWRVNRGAEAKARGTLLKAGTRKRVILKLHRYRRCDGKQTFRRLEWEGIRHGEEVPGHHLRLACPTPPPVDAGR